MLILNAIPGLWIIHRSVAKCAQRPWSLVLNVRHWLNIICVLTMLKTVSRPWLRDCGLWFMGHRLGDISLWSNVLVSCDYDTFVTPSLHFGFFFGMEIAVHVEQTPFPPLPAVGGALWCFLRHKDPNTMWWRQSNYPNSSQSTASGHQWKKPLWQFKHCNWNRENPTSISFSALRLFSYL